MRRVRIVLQARTTSKRLPAKVLLPMGGYPLAVLCAKRLGNTGREVVLATSGECSDDALTNISRLAGINVYRGNLENVLERFIGCTIDLNNEDIIVRATADNPVPDGKFVDILVEKFLSNDLNYLGTDSPSDGLPYGLSAEVFSVGALRDSAKLNITSSNLEHVTLGLKTSDKKVNKLLKGEIVSNDYSNARCTVDTLADYLEMVKVFDFEKEPIITPWHTYMKRLPLNDQLENIILGTAQFGINYGIANSKGMPSLKEVQNIIKYGLQRGIRSFDTARDYGVSEDRLGLSLDDEKYITKVMTKLQPMTSLKDNVNQCDIENFINKSINNSCLALNQKKLDVLYFHRYEDIFRWNGIAIDYIQKLVDYGVVGEIGASVYTVYDALRCISDPRIRHLQIPLNLLDTRWERSDAFQHAITCRTDLLINVRSVFLQGLLVNESSAWPIWAIERDNIPIKIKSLVKELKRQSSVDLCISYVRAFPWVDGVVLGADSLEQLSDIVDCARKQPMTDIEVSIVQKVIGDVQPRLLNPTEW